MKPHLQTPLLIYFPLLFLLLSSLFLELDAMQVVAPTLARPGCKDTCGKVSIPFPFGIGASCFLDSRYEIKCKEAFGESDSSRKPFLSMFDIEVMEIMIPDGNGTLSTLTVRIPSLKTCSSGTETFGRGIDLRQSPYNFSTEHNVVIMEGCPGNVILINQSRTVMAGCSTLCHPKNRSAIFTNNKDCYGFECCQMSLPCESSLAGPLVSLSNILQFKRSPLQFYEIGIHGQSSSKHHRCLTAALIKKDSVDQYIGKLSSTSYPSTVPVLLYWSWMSSHQPDSNPHANCWSDDRNITHCICDMGTAGNPYVLNGCQAPKDGKSCEGYYTWRKENSSYHCHEDVILAEFEENLAELEENLNELLKSGVVYFWIIGGIVIGIFIGMSICSCMDKRRKLERRVEFFKLKLEQHQSSNDGVEVRTKLFTHKQLKKATKNFKENRILGKGAQGTVYKGMLIDGQAIAVKKPMPKVKNEIQVDEIIYEIVILSQIDHRNVVKLLGCCLETEVPLLVYEFVPNGTLSKYIHGPDQDMVFSWEMRLKIAVDSAKAIAYLHSASSVPIYHKDIKSDNILLDHNHRAKVSDFGCSKAIALDQTHLTTAEVQGTFGYFDPEYFRSQVFTEKSDVYSFGVVLLELLTSKKAIIHETETEEPKNLATEFFIHVQNSSLPSFLDPEVVKEAKEEELTTFVNLTKCCLNESGRLRPTMIEVAMTLQRIIKSPTKMSTHDQHPLFPSEGFSEISLSETCDVDFMSYSCPIPVGVRRAMYDNVHPPLHDTM